MRIATAIVYVEDLARALAFYESILGFTKRRDFWDERAQRRFVSLAFPAGPADVELILEPVSHPEVRAFQAALYESEIQAQTFFVDDIDAEYERLRDLGVEFLWEGPVPMGRDVYAWFDDTCGNYILLVQRGFSAADPDPRT